MTTSNTTIYQIGRDDIITAALRKLGVIAIGQTPDTDSISNGAMALNMVISSLRTIGMPLWARKSYTFSPIANQATYNIGIGQALNTAYPLHVLQAYRQDSSSTTKIKMEVIPNFNYNLYSTSSGGIPIQLYYQPLVNYGVISVWPTPDTTATSSSITVVYQAPYQYFNSSTDTLDFPEEWYLAIVYKLATVLAPEWGIPLADRQTILKEAEMYAQQAASMGYEDGSLFIQPSFVGRGM